MDCKSHNAPKHFHTLAKRSRFYDINRAIVLAFRSSVLFACQLFLCLLHECCTSFYWSSLFLLKRRKLEREDGYAAMRNIARKFHKEVTGSKPTKAQIGQAIREGVCGRSLFATQEISLSAVFSERSFRLQGTLQRVKTQRDFE